MLLSAYNLHFQFKSFYLGFSDSSVGKESACNAGDPCLIPGLGRSPGEEKGYPLQYSGLENSRDCIVWGCKESGTTFVTPFIITPQSLCSLSPKNLFAFWFENFYLHILKLRDSFLSHVQSANEPITGIFHLSYLFLFSSYFFLVLSLNFHLPVYITHLFLHSVYFPHSQYSSGLF